jgi:putative heme-binding domain-containing protein
MLQRMPKASVVLGKEAFRQLGCASCHEVAGQRLTYGPSLKGIGGASTADYIAESILLPGRVIKDGFDVERVTLADGATLEGYVEARDDVIRVHRGVDDTVDVPAKEVTGRSRIDRSPMPELVIESVAIGELADLLAYLVAQGGDPGRPVAGQAAR